MPGVFGRLPLAVIEIRGHGDDRFRDLLAQIVFSGLSHLLQNHGRDFRRAVLFVVNLDLGQTVCSLYDLVRHFFDFAADFGSCTAHEALDGIDGFLRIRDRLTLGRSADEALAGLGERDHGRRCARSFGVRDHGGFAAFHDGDAGIRGSQVNADDFSHLKPLFLLVFVFRKLVIPACQERGRILYHDMARSRPKS